MWFRNNSSHPHGPLMDGSDFLSFYSTSNQYRLYRQNVLGILLSVLESGAKREERGGVFVMVEWVATSI